ncbi:MAG: hypothetical protein NC182_06720 [Prevotella sp.]|nr:hypothetical protein [Staphylococcus sp.]MCM1350879.1 hypothetical protein [Prevotella sp.]
MKNGVLNAKFKILIITVYTVSIFLLIGCAFLLKPSNRRESFSNYGTKPYDDNLGIALRETEDRKSVLETYSSSKTTDVERKAGKHEKSTYNLQLTLVKLTTKELNNIKIIIAARTEDGGYRYADYTTNSKYLSAQTFTSVTTFSSFSSKTIEEKEKNNSTIDVKFDETPVEFFIKILYSVDENHKILEYKVSPLEVEASTFSTYEKRNIINAGNGENSLFINPMNDVFRLKLSKTEVDETSTIDTIHRDTLKLELRTNLSGLSNYKYELDYLREHQLKKIEVPKENVWDIDPEVAEMKLEVWGKIDSKDSAFSNYVKLYALYGFFSSQRTMSLTTVTIDESLNLSDIYIVMNGEIYNGTVDQIHTSYQIDYKSLPNI